MKQSAAMPSCSTALPRTPNTHTLLVLQFRMEVLLSLTLRTWPFRSEGSCLWTLRVKFFLQVVLVFKRAFQRSWHSTEDRAKVIPSTRTPMYAAIFLVLARELVAKEVWDVGRKLTFSVDLLYLYTVINWELTVVTNSASSIGEISCS